ncbi:GNAT family N-acetyltransferase [Roseateles amylovorans]|uniref:GNAT family N-acetyltransferase n=1 Tax=Roseateles amylovorans TaxID=2978473 RepID=A0ABY6B5C4_9BURK|nr:GNAT family N-acetyltransferase [Roseateles amylovorans]UXH80581.1 GNAT family N-acetyltransferase [Roseateles amylovorans]
MITAAHDCSAFTCTHTPLTDWLQRRALPNQAAGASRTYVVSTSDQQVVGYYALAPGAVAADATPGALRRNMPQPIPVFVLGRLAVHSAWQGLGIGSGLLRDAVLRSAEAAQIVGGRALLCHSIDEQAKGFYCKHGFVQSPMEPLTVMLGLKASSTAPPNA